MPPDDIIRQFLNPSYMPGDYQNQPTGDLYSQNQINPLMSGIGGGANVSSRQAPQAGSSSYMDQYNAMLAPYQAAAQKFSSPYAVFPPNSNFTAQHPLLARGIDRGILAASMVPAGPGPRSIGEGIAGVAQGLTGANEFYRQRALQAMMLPYQMMGPRLQQMDVMSQIAERTEMVPFHKSMETKNLAYADLMAARMGQVGAPKAVQGVHIDDKGQAWQEIFDPVAGTSKLYNPETRQNAADLPADQQPQFTNAAKQRAAGSGLTPGHIVEMQMSEDPKVRAQGNQAARYYTGIMGQTAGSQAGARSAVEQPVREQTDFIKDQEKQAYATLPKMPQSDKDLDFKTRLDVATGVRSMESVQQEWQTKKQALDALWNQYRTDPVATKNKVSFQDWQRLRSGQPAPQVAPQTREKALSWNPSTGKYE
jgi:hypothetical protein